jgi:hypothetical protein
MSGLIREALTGIAGWAVPQWVLQILTTFGGTLLGGYWGYKLARQARIFEKRHDFVLEQLRGFYSPMLGLRADIDLEITRHVDKSLGDGWIPVEDFVQYIWPLYQKLAAHFTANLWLASPDTREFHKALLKLINSTAYQLETGEERERYDSEQLANRLQWELGAFYEHLDAKLDRLQRKLISGRRA